MFPLWTPALVNAIVSLVSSILIERIATDYLSARIRSASLQRKVQKTITQTLSESLEVYPGFQAEIEGNVFLDYLNQPNVVSEIAKITHPIKSPDINVLTDEWEKLVGKPIQGNNKLVIETFILRLKKQLWEVKELQEILHVKESHEANSLTISTLSKIDTNVQKLVSSLDRKETKIDISNQEKEFNVRLDVSRELLKKNRTNAALDLLIEIERELSSKQVSNNLRFRLNTLIGCCNLELGQNDGAIDRFKKALALAPENPIALSNAALAALLQNQIDQAIQLAQQSLREDGKDTGAPAILANCYGIQRGYKDLDDIVNNDYLINIDYLRTLGNLFSISKDYEKAIKYYQLCLAQNPNDFHGNINLAQLFVDTRLAPDKLYPIFKHIKDEEWQKTYSEAIKLINTALKIARQGDNEPYIWQALLARATLYFINSDIYKRRKTVTQYLSNLPPTSELYKIGVFSH